jgi:hypothetical protein
MVYGHYPPLDIILPDIIPPDIILPDIIPIPPGYDIPSPGTVFWNLKSSLAVRQ